MYKLSPEQQHLSNLYEQRLVHVALAEGFLAEAVNKITEASSQETPIDPLQEALSSAEAAMEKARLTEQLRQKVQAKVDKPMPAAVTSDINWQQARADVGLDLSDGFASQAEEQVVSLPELIEQSNPGLSNGTF